MSEPEAFRWPDRWETALPCIQRRAEFACRHFSLQPADTEDIVHLVVQRVCLETLGPNSRSKRVRTFTSADKLCSWAARHAFSLAHRRRKNLSNPARADRVGEWDPGQLVDPLVDPLSDGGIGPYLELLPNEQMRHVVRMIFEEVVPVRDIARRVGISSGQVGVLKNRALEILAERLER
jgi:hypothetical protein